MCFLRDDDLLRLLQNIENEDLLLACVGMDEEFIQRIVGQFSMLAKQYFFEDFARFSKLATPERTAKARLKIEEIYFGLIRTRIRPH